MNDRRFAQPMTLRTGARFAGPACAFVLMLPGAGLAAAASGVDPSTPRAIERFDFGDSTIFFDNESFHLKHRRLDRSERDGSPQHIEISQPTFGYVDGYPDELALLIVSANDGGTGSFTQVQLYAMRNGKPALVTALPGGDRADGGVKSARIADHRLVVEVFAPDKEGTACCPAFVDTLRYRYVRGTLIPEAKALRRKALVNKDY